MGWEAHRRWNSKLDKDTKSKYSDPSKKAELESSEKPSAKQATKELHGSELSDVTGDVYAFTEAEEEEQMEGWADECPTCVDTQSFNNTAHMR